MRKVEFDVIKGIAILAVVLYHMGLSTYGYLGVDVFFVIAGYFTTKSLAKGKIYNFKSMWNFLLDKVFRLLPLMLIASIVVLALGYFLMLPDDYENLSESVVATSWFSNNILACITTKNYWDVVNEYKPLMHTWYVGVLMEYYVFSAIFFWILSSFKEGQRKRKIASIVLLLITIASFALYLFVDNKAWCFYYLPFRLFEFTIGGLLVYLAPLNNFIKHLLEGGKYKLIVSILLILLLSLLFVNYEYVLDTIKLVTIVLLSVGLLFIISSNNESNSKLLSNKMLASLGMASYSIFVWHQIVLAFMRYSVEDVFTPITYIVVAIITMLLSFVTYKYVESIKTSRRNLIFILLMFVLVNVSALYVFASSGVVRNVPELDITKGKQVRGMHKLYTERCYAYDKDFTSNKKKILVIGNSFGRDWVNVMLESPIKDSIEISYYTTSTGALQEAGVVDEKLKSRINQADIVVLSTLVLSKGLVDLLQMNIKAPKRFIVVSEKNFGKSNGLVYSHRFSKSYFESKALVDKGYLPRNEVMKNYCKEYIDLYSYVLTSKDSVRVFTDDHRFISQDCRHLTRAGAQFFAKRIDWASLHLLDR